MCQHVAAVLGVNAPQRSLRKQLYNLATQMHAMQLMAAAAACIKGMNSQLLQHMHPLGALHPACESTRSLR